MDITQITPQLYVGGQPAARHAPDLCALKIGLLISMRAEARPHAAFNQAPLRSLWLRTYDSIFTPIPLRTLEAGSSHLPATGTSFIGRDDELASIDRLLDDPACRLLTLVGPGGAGKTRLAVEAASRRRDRYEHGVHFVPLVAVASPDHLPAAMAASLP
jgi:hypothetical protein